MSPPFPLRQMTSPLVRTWIVIKKSPDGRSTIATHQLAEKRVKRIEKRDPQGRASEPRLKMRKSERGFLRRRMGMRTLLGTLVPLTITPKAHGVPNYEKTISLPWQGHLKTIFTGKFSFSQYKTFIFYLVYDSI